MFPKRTFQGVDGRDYYLVTALDFATWTLKRNWLEKENNRVRRAACPFQMRNVRQLCIVYGALPFAPYPLSLTSNLVGCSALKPVHSNTWQLHGRTTDTRRYTALHCTDSGSHLLLQVAGSQRDLVLLHAARVPRPLGRHVVLPPARPVLVILEVVRHELRPQPNHGLVIVSLPPPLTRHLSPTPPPTTTTVSTKEQSVTKHRQ